MKTRVLYITASFLFLSFLAQAQRGNYRSQSGKTVTIVSAVPDHNLNNNRSRARRVVSAPVRSKTVVTTTTYTPQWNYSGITYTYYNNHLCAYTNAGYVHVIPPVGLQVAYLPVNSRMFRVGNKHFFENDGVYFRYRSAIGMYEVVKRPRGRYIYL